MERGQRKRARDETTPERADDRPRYLVRSITPFKERAARGRIEKRLVMDAELLNKAVLRQQIVPQQRLFDHNRGLRGFGFIVVDTNGVGPLCYGASLLQVNAQSLISRTSVEDVRKTWDQIYAQLPARHLPQQVTLKLWRPLKDNAEDAAAVEHQRRFHADHATQAAAKARPGEAAGASNASAAASDRRGGAPAVTATTPTTAPPTNRAPVALALSRATVNAALDKKRQATTAWNEGRTWWGDENFKAAEVACALTDGQPADAEKAQLRAALPAQRDLRAVKKANEGINGLLVSAERASTLIQRAGFVCAALALVVSSAPTFESQYYRKTRLDALELSRRCRLRLMSKVVAETFTFVGGCDDNDMTRPDWQTRSDLPLPPPVLFIGDHVIKRNNSKHFPFKTFLKELSKRCLVLVVSEVCTTRLCGFCGSTLSYPSKSGPIKTPAASSTSTTRPRRPDPHNGTQFCRNPQCPSEGAFMNRDLGAGAKILHRALVNFFLGGHLG